jgi:triphosphoribosyl-dephospho-CoA synthase
VRPVPWPRPAKDLIKGPEAIAALAYRALVTEAWIAPKPGLVDRRNSGAHTDMDLLLFLQSAGSLRPYLAACATTAWHCDAPEGLLSRLRPLGLAAEERMLRATGGVNTHKGAIFSLGLLTVASALAVRDGLDRAAVARLIRGLCLGLTERELMASAPGRDRPTAGQRCFRRHAVTGARGQAQAGYPQVIQGALPFLEDRLAAGHPFESACVQTLLFLIATVDDTNLLSRGGLAGLEFARSQARHLLASGLATDPAAVTQLDQAFIARNLSPGGCADLLAATCFLHFLGRQGWLGPAPASSPALALAIA